MSDKSTDCERIKAWLRLAMTPEVGAVTFRRLVEAFGSVEAALNAKGGQLTSVQGIGRQTAEKIVAGREAVDVDEELALAQEHGVQIITLDDERYPGHLKNIYDPPPVLYVKGELIRQDNLAIAMVGSRRSSSYGREQASRLSHLLAAAGFTIVSGLARGIDTQCHRGALASGGRTLAVQGRGLAKIFPEENTELAEMIGRQGAIISELPMQFEPIAGTFHARNRIIAGLSLATIVVEAARNSGALITARFALDQDREVMAVPGRIDAPGSYGPHRLIQQGAKLVHSVEDVTDTLGVIGDMIKDHTQQAATAAEQKIETPLLDANRLNLTPAEQSALQHITGEPTHIDNIIHLSPHTIGEINASLTSLQLKGLVRQLPGNYYRKKC